MNVMRIFIAAITLVVLNVIGAVHAQQVEAAAAVDEARLAQRLAAVELLLEKSSAARQVESSGDATALQKRERARQILRDAQAAFKARDFALTSTLLPEASVQMFEAVRLSAPGEVTGPKARADFAARLESVNALHAAFRRVAAEKQGTTGASETSRNIDMLVREAQSLAAEGKVEEGRASLDRAYLITRAALSSLRGGDTLVRSLSFKDKEEEYRYEVDRNDTHQMLIKVLLEGKPRSAAQTAGIERAMQARARGDAAAAAADHAGAIRFLEDATRELVRVIRTAGVFIPG